MNEPMLKAAVEKLAEIKTAFPTLSADDLRSLQMQMLIEVLRHMNNSIIVMGNVIEVK